MTPVIPRASRGTPSDHGRSSSQPEEGERLDDTSRVEDLDASWVGSPTTPPVTYPATRRQAISPQFSTPPQIQDDDSDVE